MKNYKKLPIAIFVLIVVVSVFLCGCVPKPGAQEVTELILPTMDKDQMAVIVKNAEKDYTNIVITLTTEKTVEDVLNTLLKEQRLSVNWQESEYGKFLQGIGKINAEGDSFVSVLTSVTEFYGTWAGATTYNVGTVKLVSSQVGVSELPARAGSVVYFELDTF